MQRSTKLELHGKRSVTGSLKSGCHPCFHPPHPLVARQVQDEYAQTSANGQTHTIAYEWSVPNARRRMLFTLTTASSATAQIQALGSVAIVSQ
jgi:hypothetical protein